MEDKKFYLKLAVHDALFASHSGVTPNSFSERLVIGNGWRASAYGDGSIRCSYLIKDSKGNKKEEILFKITRAGWVTTNRRPMNGESIPLATPFRLAEWPIDGVIGLVSGAKVGPYAYFQKMDYVEFLHDHQINAVRNINPNMSYTLYTQYTAESNSLMTERLITDGVTTKLLTDPGRTNQWQDGSYECYEVWKVTSAKWVIIEEVFAKTITKTLFTMTDPSNLHGIPKRK